MKDKFKVSVIIPVFNAEAYIEKAILSAVQQTEVDEILVIDDGSTDESYKIIKDLEANYPKLRIFQHHKKQNLGRSASRNLGIKKASSDFIAFLDADDYYLENRFKYDQKIFEDDPTIAGVYNAIGAHFYRLPKGDLEAEKVKLTTLEYPVTPERLFHELWVEGGIGHFSGIGLTVKKEIFEKIGYFNEKLEVAEDTELWIKISLKGKLVPGKLNESVAIRGVHDSNVFVKINSQFYFKEYHKMYLSLREWSTHEQLPASIVAFFAEQAKKYLLKYFDLDNRGYFNPRSTFYIISHLIKCRKFKALFYVVPVLFLYKPTGKGYFLRRNLIKNM